MGWFGDIFGGIGDILGDIMGGIFGDPRKAQKEATEKARRDAEKQQKYAREQEINAKKEGIGIGDEANIDLALDSTIDDDKPVKLRKRGTY